MLFQHIHQNSLGVHLEMHLLGMHLRMHLEMHLGMHVGVHWWDEMHARRDRSVCQPIGWKAKTVSPLEVKPPGPLTPELWSS